MADATARRAASWLYLVNASLLGTHEIDSAYWQEWRLFSLPGGIQLFLVLNLGLLLVVLLGLRQVVLWRRGAKALSLFLAAAGIFACAAHTLFIATGRPEFQAPVSLAILGATLLVSIAQLVVVLRAPPPG